MIKEYLKQRKAKNELIRVFRQGGLYLHFKRNEKNFYIFPKIHSINFKDNYTEYAFTLPLGLDPDLLQRHFHVFRQMYGENVEISNEINNDKSFTLKVYNSDLPSLVPFNYEQFKEKIEGIDIPIIMGADHRGELCVFDLKKFHHCQVTGITNIGKSIYLRAILTALSLYFSSQQIQFYLADLKRTELTIFKRLEHTKKTVTNLSDLELMLLEVLQEVEKRYLLMEKYEVSHMDDVNRIIDKPFPHIIVMIDEFGLCAESKEILKLVQDLTSIARAANVYLFLSLQRIDSTTITGIAKNNLGVKISFKQSNGINAKIAGVEGVEDLKLSDKGRAIMDVGSDMKKIQCPYLTVEEAKRLIRPFTTDKAVEAHSKPQRAIEDYSDIFGVLGDE